MGAVIALELVYLFNLCPTSEAIIKGIFKRNETGHESSPYIKINKFAF